MVESLIWVASAVDRPDATRRGASLLPADLAVGAEVGAADPLAFGVEDRRDDLLAGELLVGAFEQRPGQLRDVGRLDVARHAEPEPSVPLQVGLDVPQVLPA